MYSVGRSRFNFTRWEKVNVQQKRTRLDFDPSFVASSETIFRKRVLDDQPFATLRSTRSRVS